MSTKIKVPFTQRHEILREKIECEIGKAIRLSTQTSEHTGEQCLKVSDDLFIFVADGRALVEVAHKYLIDEDGLQYSYDVLETEHLCELADDLLNLK
jgi:hypothetical protein